MSADRLDYRRMTLDDIDQVMLVEREVYQFPWTERIFSDCIRVGYHCWLAVAAWGSSRSRGYQHSRR